MRVASKGILDQDQEVTFYFDSKPYQGFVGDTVASALLANDVHLVGRSFKYHRPRGILGIGSEEPNALISVHKGGKVEPNVRATTQEIYEGLIVTSQNSWPNLKFDALAINDITAPFFSAGFYYKTFMWPPRFWEALYEPIIRRAAGLGKLDCEPDNDNYDQNFAFCDLLIIGGGPSGLFSALLAGRAGLDVILVDENPNFGGRLLFENTIIDGNDCIDWIQSCLGELKSLKNVRMLPRATVFGVYDQGTFGVLERVSRHVPSSGSDSVLDCFWRIVASSSILASGAIERHIAFGNNDRPGIMMASAVRGYLNHYGVAAGKSISIFGNNDDAFNTANDLNSAGVEIAAYVDSRRDANIQGDFPIFRGAEVYDTGGRLRLEHICIRDERGERKIQTDCLGVAGGWNPSIHLSCHTNAKPEWKNNIAAFIPKTDSVSGMTVVGSAIGHFTTSACFQSVGEAVSELLKSRGMKITNKSYPVASDLAYNITPLWAVQGNKRAWIDFQNDVTTKDIKQSVDENFRSVEHMKRYTTQGMATDQGKGSNVIAVALLADASGETIEGTGTTTFRPPYTSIPIAAIGSSGKDKGFAPERLTTTHDTSIKLTAPMVESGLWYRPSYYPEIGEYDWLQSCNREVLSVRQNVGICDVSTLGKIELHGKDTAQFLDFVYANSFSSLAVGRVRYGLMLREDGFVMDDGTSARISENSYLMTTTTAAAGSVMRHLDFVHQAYLPELNVKFVSVTEQWAQFAVSGPKSTDVISSVMDGTFHEKDWPFMACGEVKVMGIKARLFRISFSGELGYELAIPARFGSSLFNVLKFEADQRGGGVYGMEAMNVLRMEKGFITHAEIDGRATAYDVGLQKMISEKKDFIGNKMAQRPGLLDPNRERLVGLKTNSPQSSVTAGSHLFNIDDEPLADNNQGYISSAAFSPIENCYIGLAFLKRGPERWGEKIKAVNFVADTELNCEICPPVFYDPGGKKIRA